LTSLRRRPGSDTLAQTGTIVQLPALPTLDTSKEAIAMKVSEAMTSDVEVANPSQSLREAAMAMVKLDVGALPVGENDRLVGMITDRDIAVRGVAKGMGPETKIRDVMSVDVRYCFEDD